MDNITQEEATEAVPLIRGEKARFWRAGRFGGMECLQATFITHSFAPHAHDTLSIGAIEAGCQIGKIKGERRAAGPGDFYLINAGEVHDGHPGGEGYRYRMIYPDVDLLRDIIEDMTGRPFNGRPAFSRQMLNDPPLAQSFHAAHRALEAGGGALETDERMYEVLGAMYRRHGEAIIVPVATREPSAAARARDFIEENYALDIDLAELAAVSGLSRAHLIRAFRREFHITPHAFLTDRRVRAARGFLRAGLPPADVAARCGFADQAHLTRHFKARTGITPGVYRAA